MTGRGATGADRWAGLRALLLLSRLRARARLRGFVASLRQPRRLAALVVLAGVIALVLAGQHMSGSEEGVGRVIGEGFVPALLLFFVGASLVGSVRHGTLAYMPAEVQFLLPAPISSRALIASHLIDTTAKVLSASLALALFVRPFDASFPLAVAGYLLTFLVLVVIGLDVDLAHGHLPSEVRLARGRRLGWLLAAAAVAVVGVTAWADGGLSVAALRHLAWPIRPFLAIIGARDGVPLAEIGGVLGFVAVLAIPPLAYRGTVREAALRASDRVAVVLERYSKGSRGTPAPREQVTGRTLRMLPHWRGAGVHAWRQLVALTRQRRVYVTLLVVCAISGSVALVVSDEFEPAGLAAPLITIVALFGPYYVQCDFRSDYDNLPWLRSLPTPPGALAAGQLMASGAVLYLFELAVGGWILFVAPAEHRLAWTGVFLALPCLNLLQLSVENGAFLLYPLRLDASKGPPGAVQLARMYALIIVKVLVLVTALGIAALAGAAGWVAGPVVAGVCAFAVLIVETVLAVWLVGRLFVRVDPARDLGA